MRELAVPAAVVVGFTEILKPLLPANVQLEVGTLDLRGHARLDSGALARTLSRLCRFAIDAMPAGGTIRLACRNTFLDAAYLESHPWITPGPHVCLSISDTRTGLTDATTQAMAAISAFMHEHQGMVHISEIDRGTEVRLYFPIAEPLTGAA